jgi:hypothetical protein
MGASPQFIVNPKTWMQTLSVGNTALDGTGTLADVMTAASSIGSRIDRVHIKASGTTSAGMIRLFKYDGTNTYFYRDILVAAITPSATVQAWEGDLTLSVDLPPNWHLKASTHNSEAFKIFAHGGDYS